jgi:hypothetical protein
MIDENSFDIVGIVEEQEEEQSQEINQGDD